MTNIPEGGSPLRLLVFYDQGSNGQTIELRDVLQGNPEQPDPAERDPFFWSPINQFNIRRFTILYDKLKGPLSVDGNVGIGGVIDLNLYHPAVYDISTDDIRINTGGLYFAWAQAGGIINDQPFDFWARLNYQDK